MLCVSRQHALLSQRTEPVLLGRPSNNQAFMPRYKRLPFNSGASRVQPSLLLRLKCRVSRDPTQHGPGGGFRLYSQKYEIRMKRHGVSQVMVTPLIGYKVPFC